MGHEVEEVVLYGWYNFDWGHWFYIGVGTKNRAKDKRHRSRAFRKVVASFLCEPRVLLVFPRGTSHETVEKTEKTVKQILLDLGEPIRDLEPDVMRREAVMAGIAEAKKAGKYVGRKPIEVDEAAFTEQYRAWKNGETAPKFICKKLGLSHSTFYRRVRAYEKKHGIRMEASNGEMRSQN